MKFALVLEKDLDAVLHEIVARWGIPALAVGIVKGDEIVNAKGFGVQIQDRARAEILVEDFIAADVIDPCFGVRMNGE